MKAYGSAGVRPIPIRLASVLLVCLLARPAMSAPDAAPPATNVSSRLEQIMESAVALHHFSGVVLIASNGKRLLAKGYGSANLEWGAPNTLTTRFRIGSLTKQFTAMAILQLRMAGRLRLQDSICQYLDPCPKAWKPVTLHNLLSHTSGIPVDGPPYPWTAASIATDFADRPLEFVPGSRFKYSDWGYNLLGLVIEKVTGMAYEEVLRQQIFSPLGMHDTGYDHVETIMPHRAAGYRFDGEHLVNAEYTPMKAPFSAGGLYSTAEDLYKWDQALYGDTLLAKAARRLMFTPVLNHYGYGWLISRPATRPFEPPAPGAVPGHFELAATGFINGFSSAFLRFPDDRVTIIVLSNIEGGTRGLVLYPGLAGAVFEAVSVTAAKPNAKERPESSQH